MIWTKGRKNMNQMISVKKFGKKWVVFHYGFITIWMVLACIFFFVDNVAVHSFMLLYVSPVAMIIFLIYFAIIIDLNLRMDKDKNDLDC